MGNKQGVKKQKLTMPKRLAGKPHFVYSSTNHDSCIVRNSVRVC